jgi:hypothetical protein
VSSDGKEITIGSTSKYDGKDYPIKGSPDFDTGKGKRIDANTAETTLMRMGKVVAKVKRTISQDGKDADTGHQRHRCQGGPLRRNPCLRPPVRRVHLSKSRFSTCRRECFGSTKPQDVIPAPEATAATLCA